MPENWLLPTITSNYATGVIQAINNKFIDAITLFRGGVGSNLPVSAIRFNGDLDGTFQRWNGTVWNNMRLAVAGGGTGSDNPAGARTNLELGTMAVQNSNLVNITGGTAVFSSMQTTGLGTFGQLSTADGSQIANINAANIALGVINPARLANGTPNSTVFLRGDSVWASPAGTLPSGMIAIFDVACPVGWTRMAAWDNRFPRAAATPGGVGGINAHYHDGSGFSVASHAHDAGSLVVASHGHSSGSLSIPAHGHTGSISVSGSVGSGGGHDHYFAGTTGGESNGQMNCDAGASGNMSRSQHTHDFSGRVESVGNHTHSFSGSGSVTINNAGGIGCSGTTGATAPDVSGSTGAAAPSAPCPTSARPRCAGSPRSAAGTRGRRT